MFLVHILILAFSHFLRFAESLGCMFEIVPGIKTPVSEQEFKIGFCEENTKLSENYCNESSIVR